MEKRTVTLENVEVRKREDGGLTFRGYAAIFDSPALIGGRFEERVAPTAFHRALQEGQDVRHLINHDASLLLGRTRSGTTRLTATAKGLAVETDLPDTSYARDLQVLSERRDMDQMSFAFDVPAGGDTWDWESMPPKRTLTDLNLSDVSSVTFPAYVDTSGEVTAEVRSLLDEHAADAQAARAKAGEIDKDVRAAIDQIEERVGAVLSAQSKEHASNAMASLSDAQAHLQRLMESAGEGDGGNSGSYSADNGSVESRLRLLEHGEVLPANAPR